jgi:hypothetical protein
MTSRLRTLHPSRSPLGVLILVTLVYVTTVLLIEHRSFWIIDNQIKFLQMERILHSGFRDFSLPWPGAEIDPRLTYQPMVFPFYAEDAGRLYAAYSPVFPTLAAGLVSAFGSWGLYVMPLAGSILALFGLAHLGAQLGLSSRARCWAVLIAGLLGPLWFYSAIFWEHTLAVCAAVWGVAFSVQFLRSARWRHLVAGSALAASGIYLRDDLYVFCAALALVLFVRSSRNRWTTAAVMGATMVASLVPLWLFQWKTIGQPFGFHIGVHLFDFPGLSRHFMDRPVVFDRLFARCSSSPWSSLALAAPFLAAFVVRPRLPERAFRWMIPVGAVLAVISFLFIMQGYFTSNSPLRWMLKANSLFAVSPILIIAFLRLQESRETSERTAWVGRFLGPLALTNAVIYGLASPLDASEGIHWGNRLLLVLYPIFAVMAAENLDRWTTVQADGPERGWRWGKLAIGLTVAVSFAAQLYSITLLNRKQEFTYRLNQTVAARPEPAILTDVWWAPLELYSQFYEKPIFRVRSREQMNDLLSRFQRVGIDACLFATAPNRQTLLPPDATVARVDDGGLNLFSLKLMRIEVGPGAVKLR